MKQRRRFIKFMTIFSTTMLLPFSGRLASAAGKRLAPILGRAKWEAVMSGRPVRSDDVREASDGTDLILVHTDSSKFRLNATGRFIWSQCNGKRKMPDIARALQHQCRIDYREAMADTALFLYHLYDNQLVTV